MGSNFFSSLVFWLNTEFMQETKVLALYVFHIILYEDSSLYIDESVMTLVDLPVSANQIAVSLEWVLLDPIPKDHVHPALRSDKDEQYSCRGDTLDCLVNAFNVCMPGHPNKLKAGIWEPVMHWIRQFKQATEIVLAWECSSLYVHDTSPWGTQIAQPAQPTQPTQHTESAQAARR